MENEPSSSNTFQHNCFDKSEKCNIDNTVMMPSMIVNEKRNDVIIKSHHISQNVDTKSIASANNLNTNSNSSPKMGSRRIFTPQFKLQVLESYRNDNDCKGNQRATARKYNIHRRQIQKWLQCESNLRSTVANVNRNNVKHQFHNITHQQQLPVLVINDGNHFNHSQQKEYQQQHFNPYYSLDKSIHNNTMNSISVPSLSTNVTTSTTVSAPDILATSNLAAVSVVATTGALTTSSASPTNTLATISPIRPTALIGSSTRLSQSTLHPQNQHQYQHHHQYPSMTFTPSPATVQMSVPILTHHLPPKLFSDHYSYQRNSSLPAQTKPSAFMSSSCLPATVLSVTAVASSTPHTTSSNTAKATKLEVGAVEQSEKNLVKLHETITSNITGNGYAHSDVHMYRFTENIDEKNYEEKRKGLQSYTYLYQPHSLSTAVTPMDLSLSSKRDVRDDSFGESYNSWRTNGMVEYIDISNDNICNDNSVVDLTFRKRKVIAKSNEYYQSEKLTKISAMENKNKDYKINNRVEPLTSNSNAVDTIDEKKSLASKPIKLFKPYLLDDEKKTAKFSFKSSESTSNEQREPIIWSNHPDCLLLRSFDNMQDSSRGSIFQSSSSEKYTFLSASPYFPENKTSSPKSDISATSAPVLSPGFCCPKGSPVSGYESSSSTYSDTSYSKQCRITTNNTANCFDIRIHANFNDNLVPQQNHVRRWLDQGINTTQPILYA